MPKGNRKGWREDWNPVDWESLDWRQQDIEIAAQIGRTRERVRQMRRKLRKPDPADKWMRRGTKENLRKVRECMDFVMVVSDRQAGAVLGLQKQQVSSYRYKRLGRAKPKRSLPSKLPRELVNWNLPNRDISEIWQVHWIHPAGTRWRNGIGPPAWDGRKRSTRENVAYLEAVARERRRAEAWRLGNSALEQVAASSAQQVTA